MKIFFLISDGPLSILQQKIDKKKLEPDEHQLKVAKDLQKLYETVSSYEPKAKSWFSFGKKKDVEIKGLCKWRFMSNQQTIFNSSF